MPGSVIFDPYVPLAVLAVAAIVAVALGGWAAWRGLSGWWLRTLAALALLAAVANPSLQREQRTPLSDIVIVVADRTASQRLEGRPGQLEQALAGLKAQLALRPNTEMRLVELADAPGDGGTLLMERLSAALADEPPDRIAGVILLTDGQVHDMERAPELPAPLHVLLTGKRSDWDRRLVVRDAPAFAILGEPVMLTLMIEDQGQVPVDAGGRVELQISIDGGEVRRYRVPVGQPLRFPVTLEHGGMNVIRFTVPTAEGELTDRNNSAVVQINGVRDRLRVLLVSGEPYPGERTWRNLLKSDSSVDLVHFTILRPPEKQDGVPVDELSLIAFPTRELFLDKIDEFDLIIFDRYRRRGILPSLYLDNVRSYVERGGAVLIAAGPAFASADSLYRSPLGAIMPAVPTSRVIEEGFRPRLSAEGARHPVTEGLEEYAPPAAEGEEGPGWGRWFRRIEVTQRSGTAVMTDETGAPLLVLDRVGEGRVALLASDQAWLWSRGFEGGGPQLELLRRLAHWTMKEPELEEEALTATAQGQVMTIVRRTMGEGPREVEITAPDGTVSVLPMREAAPGRFVAEFEGPEIGLYRLREGDLEAVAALGPAAPREFEETIASGEKLAPLVSRVRGGVLRLEDGLPVIREVRPGRVAAGRGWIGLTPREAYLTTDVRVMPLLPAWLFLLVAAMLSVVAWLREGRR